MNRKTCDVLVHIIASYPRPQHLSKARLTKLVYLSDWVSALNYGKQITDIRWYFNHYGPYVGEVVDAARSDPRLVVMPETNYYGSPMERVSLAPTASTSVSLEDWERTVIVHVIAQTKDMAWDAFIRAVYSTYPVLTQPRGSFLDLVGLAAAYHLANSGKANA